MTWSIQDLRSTRPRDGVWPVYSVDKTILFMGNHGVATIGKTVAEAYDKLYYVERAAQVQLYAMWTGQPLRELSQERRGQHQEELRWQ